MVSRHSFITFTAASTVWEIIVSRSQLDMPTTTSEVLLFADLVDIQLASNGMLVQKHSTSCFTGSTNTTWNVITIIYVLWRCWLGGRKGIWPVTSQQTIWGVPAHIMSLLWPEETIITNSMHALNLNVSIVNILDHSKIRCAIILDAAVLSCEISTQVVNVKLWQMEHAWLLLMHTGRCAVGADLRRLCNITVVRMALWIKTCTIAFVTWWASATHTSVNKFTSPDCDQLMNCHCSSNWQNVRWQTLNWFADCAFRYKMQTDGRFVNKHSVKATCIWYIRPSGAECVEERQAADWILATWLCWPYMTPAGWIETTLGATLLPESASALRCTVSTSPPQWV